MLACAASSVREKEDAYFGDPTAASVEEREAHFTTPADILTLSIMEYLGSKAEPRHFEGCTPRFSSSDQLSTTSISAGGGAGRSTGSSIRKRWPSRETS